MYVCMYVCMYECYNTPRATYTTRLLFVCLSVTRITRNVFDDFDKIFRWLDFGVIVLSQGQVYGCLRGGLRSKSYITFFNLPRPATATAAATATATTTTTATA